MNTKGGMITIDFGSQRVSARGKVSISGNKVMTEAGVHMDGTGFTTVKPKLASADIGEIDRGIDITDEMLLSQINVTIFEIHTGVTHLFTNARLTGETGLDLEAGSVSGLKVESDQYQKVKR